MVDKMPDFYYSGSIYPLKEHYRIGKKQKLWRSQIYIKLTRSNDDDSWKHPLKYICLKCHIWWEINNLTLCLEFIAQWAFLFIFILASMQCKIYNRFFTILSWPRWRNRSQTSTGLSVYVYGGLYKVLTLPAPVLLTKNNSVMFL